MNRAELPEYSPPQYLVERGVIVLGQDAYLSLRRMVEKAPSLPEVADLSGAEAARVAQWEAPGQVLGRFPGPVAPRAEAFQTPDGNLDTEEGLELLAEAIRRLESSAFALLRGVHSEDSPFTAFFELPGAPGWSPLALWPYLPEPVRASLLALAEAARPRSI